MTRAGQSEAVPSGVPAPRAVPTDRERGSLHVAAIPMVLALVALACLLVLIVGSGLSDRRSTVTAADAAALAAADVLDGAVERRFEEVRGADPIPEPGPRGPTGPRPVDGGTGDDEGSGDEGSDDEGSDEEEEPTPAPVWALAGTALEDVADLEAAAEAAERFAEANGAELVEVRFDLERWLVRVEVRHREPLVEGDGARAHAVAVARVRPTGGLCVSDGEIGVRLGRSCRTSVPQDGPALVTPTVDRYTSRVGLVS